MITEIVKFPVPPDITREELMDKYRKTIDRWQHNPDLIRKHYFFDHGNSLGGGVYIWKNSEAVDRWHGEEYREMIRVHYGAEPVIECFDTMVIVDNENELVIEVDAE